MCCCKYRYFLTENKIIGLTFKRFDLESVSVRSLSIMVYLVTTLPLIGKVDVVDFAGLLHNIVKKILDLMQTIHSRLEGNLTDDFEIAFSLEFHDCSILWRFVVNTMVQEVNDSIGEPKS